jgi:GNAT superfamily N-acetyltransferase
MEAAEEYGALGFARAMQRQHPARGVAWQEFGGGHLIFVAKGAPVGRAHGLGFAGKVSASDIEKVEEFYFHRDASAQVDVCPYADPSLFEAVNAGDDIEIRQVQPREAGSWSALLSRIFFGDQAAEFQDLFTPWASLENPLCLAALVDGRMIAGAGGMIVPEHRMAAFFGAGTLPEYRSRGIQTAFMHERLRIAQQAGCDLAVTLTLPGTTSQRNVERAGFRTAYTKVVVSKTAPGQ